MSKTILKQNIYCDMDGVLADFNGKRKAIKRFNKEKGFFQKLKPIKHNLKAIKKLLDKGANITILSASPNEQADYDKKKWLEKHLPEIDPRNIVLCRLGEDKADYIDNMKNSILIDDYTTNLIKWEMQGGKGLKFLNKKYDSAKGMHTLKGIKTIESIEEII